MINNKAIFFFEKLNFFNFFFILLLRLFFFKNRFFYRNLSKEVETKFFLKILSLVNIECLNYKEVGYKNYIKNFVSDCVELTNYVL